VKAALRRHATLIVLTALVAIFALVLWRDQGRLTTTEERERKHSLCPFFRRDEVTEIVVKQGGRSARVFRGEHTDAGQRPWQIEIDGTREPAEEAAVDQLLGSLRDGTVVRRVEHFEPSERKEFGLDQPRGEITVTFAATRVHLTFGKLAPTPKDAVWVEVEGHGVVVITAQLASALLVGPDALRRKALVSWEASALDAIELEGAGGRRRLVRAPWRVPRGAAFRFDGSTPEGHARVSAAALDRVWEGLGELKADAFLPADEAAAALEPAVTVTLSPSTSRPVVLKLGGACPGHADDVVAVRTENSLPPLAACVPRGALEALSIPTADLVDRHAIGARADEVIDLKLQRGDATLTLARSGAQWHEQTPLDRPVEPEVGRALLDKLLEVAAVRAPSGGDPKALGLDPPRATVRVVSLVGDGQEDRTELVEVGSAEPLPDGGEVVHLRRVEDGVFLDVSGEAAAALAPDELALRSRKVLDLQASQFHAFRITGPFGPQDLRNDGNRWSVVEPHGEGLAPDVGLIAELEDAVGKLSAERWVGTQRPEHGLEHPRITIATEVGAGKDAHSVEVALGAPVGAGGSFARVSGDPTVFVAGPNLETTANRWLIDRQSLLVDLERMTRAALTAGDKNLVLEKNGGALRIAGASASDPAATARASTVRDALGALIADAAVSVGPPPKAQGFDKPTLRIAITAGSERFEIQVGARDAYRGANVHYARREGVAATFVIADTRLAALFEAVR
jgi:hypothetical protein